MIARPAIRPTIPKEWPQDHFDAVLDDCTPHALYSVSLTNVAHLQIEMTNHCDLQCVECPQRLMQRYRQWMTMDVLEAILTKLLARYRFDTIIPHKDGESLLYPHIIPSLRMMAQLHRGKFTIYTNGTHFTKAFYDFIRTTPNQWEVFMSFHFVGYRTKMRNCGEVVNYSCDEGAAMLMECLAEPAANVDFAISTHITQHSDMAALHAWKSHWDSVAARHSQLKGVHLNPHINPWAGHIDAGTVSFPACPYGDGAHMFIGVTGTILPCCMDLNEELALGNLVTDSLDEIIARRRRFYDDVAVPSHRQPRCVTCLGGCR